MGCGATKPAAPILAVDERAESQSDGTITDEDLLRLIKSGTVQPTIGAGRTGKDLKAALDLLDLKDEAVKDKKWDNIGWTDIQESSAYTIIKPSTMHQGGTTICGAISVLEAMAYFRPSLYSRLVLAVYLHGQVITHEGRPWGATPDLKPALLAAEPPTSALGYSSADWMVSTSMIAELKDQSFVRDLLGQDDFLGQDARSPDGTKTVDHAAGLTCAWDVKRFMVELLGCSEVERSMAYWVPRPSVTEQMVALTDSGALERGETVLICLISEALWEDSSHDPRDASGWAMPSHWVRVRAVARDGEALTIDAFSYGEVQQRTMSAEGWGRCYFEALFGKLNEERS